MQSDVVIVGTEIEGTLANITDGSVWDAGTWSQDESTGHYMFLKATGIPDGATATVEIINGVHGPTTLDSDKNIVLRITNTETQQIKLTVTYNGQTATKTYTLADVVLA